MSSLFEKIRSVPFGVLWRTALVRLPRAVPLSVLRFTSPQGPHPFVFNLPSRNKSYTIPLYIFVPDQFYHNLPEHGAPVLVDFHGGGFYLGSCMEQAPFCSQIARDMQAIVITVDYRMGPFHGFPAAIEDGEDVLNAILDPQSPGYQPLRQAISARIEQERAKMQMHGAAAVHAEEQRQFQDGQIQEVHPPPKPVAKVAGSAFHFDLHKLAVSGFSSGGNLALNLALHIRPPELPEEWPSVFDQDHPAPIPFLLFYPSFDLRQLPSQRSRPAAMMASSPFWTQVADSLAPTYADRNQTHHPRVSPGLASLESIHPAVRMFLVLCELDTLAEQSKQWVHKVKAHPRADDLVVEEVDGAKHGWTQMPDGWLTEQERQAKQVCFAQAQAFITWAWQGSPAESKPSDNNVARQQTSTRTSSQPQESQQTQQQT
ncbi:alpha/beta-hydrolase [Testicularia cyperi]|uniref:Alpha/beta-hydrolase n=1 Tax=Testicularia cyperi TaxID=1882483 RepID=A0A317XVZ9_9BASI|nr:alpha/beta-hydrolase [Testicularia cyperi]